MSFSRFFSLRTAPPANTRDERQITNKHESLISAHLLLPADNLRISSDNQTRRGMSSDDRRNVNQQSELPAPQPAHRSKLPASHR